MKSSELNSLSQAKSDPVSLSTYLALAVVCLGTIGYEILLTRIFSVIMWYHFAFMAVSIAMFGMTAGAVIVYLMRNKIRHPHRVLSISALLFSIAVFVTFLITIRLPFYVSSTRLVGISYILTSIPFIFSGICVSIALTRFPERISKLYAADLAGAAAGCVFLIFILNATDGPTSVFIFAALIAVGSFLFAFRERHWIRIAAATVAVSLILFSSFHAYLVRKEKPLVRIQWAKGRFLKYPIYERWNSFSRIQVKDDRDENAPTTWGLSTTYDHQPGIKELQLDIDANATTVLTNFNGKLSSLEHLKYDVTNFPHYLRNDADVFVVGMGGGRDVLSALVFNQKSVTGVEMNDQIIEAVQGRFADFTGHIYRNPRVTTVNDEARSYLSRQQKQYDLIQVSLIDTWAATAAGAFALSENSLYTVQAWDLFLRKLSPRGILSFSRWHSNESRPQIYRLASLALESLKQNGVSEPYRHIAVVSSTPKKRNRQLRSIATMMVSRSPFTKEDLTVMQNVADKLQFRILASPVISNDRNLARFIAGKPVRGLTESDISPSTDDRPFFFNTFPSSAFWKLWTQNPLNWGQTPVSVLTSLLLLVTILTLLCIIIPLLLTFRQKQVKGSLPFVLFFAAIGFGFMIVEISQVQRLAIFLGHPTYSLSVVLFSLLLSTGAGSYFTNKIPDAQLRSKGRILLLTLIGVVILFGFLTPKLIRMLEDSGMSMRIILSVVILAPMGFFMGTAFPIGMRLARDEHQEAAPWFWGINGATSVCASVLAVCVALVWGISASFWLGFLFYVAAFLCFLIKSTQIATD